MSNTTISTATKIYKSAFGSTFTLILVMGTAFTVSLLWRLGLEVLPLVDKGHLLILLAFYTSAITVAVRLVFSVAQIGWVLAVDIIESKIGSTLVEQIKTRGRGRSYTQDQVASLAQRIARKRLAKNWVWYVILGLPMIALYGWLWKDSARSAIWDTAGIGGIVLLLLGIALAANVATALSQQAEGRHPSTYRHRLIFNQFLLLLLSFQAGSAWADYLKDRAPRVTAEVRSWTQPQRVSIAMPGTEGILGFVGDDQAVSYLPWSEIIQLRASSPTPSSSTDFERDVETK